MWSTNKSGKKEPLSLQKKKAAEKKKALAEKKKRMEDIELEKAREKADKGGYKVLQAQNLLQLERKNVDEKEMRRFLKSQLGRTDDERAEEQALFTQGKIPAERKKFFKHLASIPDSIQKDLIAGYLSQHSIKAEAYMKQWLKDANTYKAYIRDRKSAVPNLKTEKAGSADYGYFLYSGGDADADRILKQEKLAEIKAAQKKKAKAKAERIQLLGNDSDADTDDDDLDDFAASLEAEMEEMDGPLSSSSLVGEAVEKMLKDANITDPDSIQIKIKDSKGNITKGTQSIPKRWLDEEENKVKHGRAQPDTGAEYIIDSEPWAVGRMQRADKEDEMYARIWNLSAQIQGAWAKLESLDAPSVEIMELRNELKALYHTNTKNNPTLLEPLQSDGTEPAWDGVGWYANKGYVGPDSERAKEIHEQLRVLYAEKDSGHVRNTGKDAEIKELIRTIETMQSDLRLLKMEAPKTIRQYQEVARCGAVYREAPWLHAGVKRVYISPTDGSLENYKYIVAHTSRETKTRTLGAAGESQELGYGDQAPIEKNGRTWYMARNGFFELLCTAKGKTQEGDILTIPLPRDIVKRYGIHDAHPKLSVIVAYDTNRGFFVQDEKVHKSELEYFAEKKKSLSIKLKDLSSQPVTIHARILGASILSDALESTSSPGTKGDALDNDFPEFPYGEVVKATNRRKKPTWYGADGTYVKKAILSIAFKDGKPVTMETFARKLGDVVIYIGPHGSKTFEERIRNRYYVDPQLLMDLPSDQKAPLVDLMSTRESDKFPEVFDERSGVNEKIISWYRDEYVGRLDSFITEFLRSVYAQESGERIVSATVPTWDRTQPCQNVSYLESKTTYTTYGKNGNVITGNKLEMTKLAHQERKKIQNVKPRDLIHYMENGTVFCFTVSELKNLINTSDKAASALREGKKSKRPVYINPLSGEPFSREFIKGFKAIYMNGIVFEVKRPDQLEEDDTRHSKPVDLTMVLAPGLIEKIKEGLDRIRNPPPESDDESSGDDEVISRSRGSSSRDDEGDSDAEPQSDDNYDGKCRHCKGELDSGSKGMRTLLKKTGASEDATGTDAFYKREFCCRYCCEDCDEFEKKSSK